MYVHILSVLTSLYPLGIVPEISSVDVKQPAGQYLLSRETHTHTQTVNIRQLDHCTHVHTKQTLFT